MKTVLVTGGHGFIGRRTFKVLREHGYDPIAFDRRRPDDPEYPYIVGDLRDANGVNEAVAHCDGVIHLGGILGTQETIENPLPAAETNILGGLNVLEAVTQYNIPLVNIAVGNYWMNNTYSISKNSVERFAEMYATERGTKVNNLRALNAYGPGQSVAAPFGPSKVRKIMPAFICRALLGQPIEIYGDGSQVMDMVYVKNVARDLLHVLEWTAADSPYAVSGKTFESGTGRATSVVLIAKIVLDEVGSGTINHLPMRPGEPEQSVVIAEDPFSGVDYTSLEEGVRKTVKWYRKNWLPHYEA